MLGDVYFKPSYCPYHHVGSVFRENDSNNYNYVLRLSFTPNYERDIDAHLSILKAWSQEGVWNYVVFRRFIAQFEKTAVSVEEYYKNNYNLANYARNARALLSKYVYELFSSYIAAKTKIYDIHFLSAGNLEALKMVVPGLSKEELNELLHRAILSDTPTESIEFIIQSGADINHKFHAETPMINAVMRPEIIKLLLEHKANIHEKNDFGKTALFYAIQFGSKESVELLLKAGEKINDSIYSLKQMKDADLCEMVGPEGVADFTPLIYAFRYASDEMLNLMIEKGANIGKADPDKVYKWVGNGENITKNRLDRLKNYLKIQPNKKLANVR